MAVGVSGMVGALRTWRRTEGRWLGDLGQSTVEAAALLPTLMLLFALLMQPVCMLYTAMVMRDAAAEAARVYATTDDEGVARSFALRRLGAVPEASLFHVGGQGDWAIEFSKSQGGREVSVGIRGHVRPLPLMGTIASALGRRDGAGVVLEAEVRERTRPQWLEGDYASWMQCW